METYTWDNKSKCPPTLYRQPQATLNLGGEKDGTKVQRKPFRGRNHRKRKTLIEREKNASSKSLGKYHNRHGTEGKINGVPGGVSDNDETTAQTCIRETESKTSKISDNPGGPK